MRRILLLQLHRKEDGFAMAVVAMLGAFLILVSAVIVVRTIGSTNVVSDDRQWEQALYVAESSVDYGLAELQDDAAFNTGHVYADVDTRDEVVAAALGIANDPSHPSYTQAVHETGEGLTVIVKPFDAEVLYGVGITPSLEDYNNGVGKVRIVITDLSPPYWQPQQAILVGGPAKLEAKKDDKDIDMTCSAGAPPGCTAGGGWIHFNGQVEWKEDKTENNITGCFSAYGAPDTITKENGDDRKNPDKLDGPYTNNDDTAYPHCPDNQVQDAFGPPPEFEHDGDIPYVPIPEIDPLAIHYRAQYDVCPDGIRWGPSGETSPYWTGSVPPVPGDPTRALPYFPCTGDSVTGPYIDGDWLLGLKEVHKLGEAPTDRWDKKVEFNKETVDGIFFLWGRSAKIKKVKAECDPSCADRQWTIIASKGAARTQTGATEYGPAHTPVSNDLTCLGKDDLEVWNPKELKWEDLDKDQYGDIELEVENQDIVPYGWTGDASDPGPGGGYLIVTSGDIKIKVKGKKDLPDPGDITGIIAAHEQMRVESNDADEGKGAIYGSVIAQDACDTPESLHRDKLSEFKKGDIINNGNWGTTDFIIADVTEFRIADQNEF